MGRVKRGGGRWGFAMGLTTNPGYVFCVRVLRRRNSSTEFTALPENLQQHVKKNCERSAWAACVICFQCQQKFLIVKTK